MNRLALALLHVFRRPLPDVLRETVMDPIGASSTWVWRGYSTSTVEIDGHAMESVSGGAHWGGGLVISSEDHARVGHLVLRDGRWNGRTVLPAAYLAELREPCPLHPVYGLLWWLNTDGGMYPSAPRTSVFAVGMGTNMIWIDPDHDMVVVARWARKETVDGLVARVMASLA